MARLNSTLASRIALVMLAAHGVLLPALFFGLMRVVERGLADQFTGQVRAFARVVADDFEVGDALESTERTRALLDSAILRGDGVYAELRTDGLNLRSTLGPPDVHRPGLQDLGFGNGGDDAYFLKLPIDHNGRQAELWLGFDERPTLAQMAEARERILVALGAYFALTMTLALLVGRWLARPLIELQRSSRRVASGEHQLQFAARTSLREVAELAADLERMRGELVGVGERLRDEISAKEALETQLRRRQRLETVGTLAGGVAHEFNNALVPIILYTESMLLDAPAGSSQREDLEGVLGAARRARDIVRKVLAFSSSFEPARLEPVRVEAVIDEVLKLFTALVPANVEVRRAVEAGVPWVQADPGLLNQLIMNLCTNAYQAMHGNGGVLTVGLRSIQSLDGKGGPGVELYVADTGHGMDAATLERIFEPFFTTREVGVGTGLGLSVAHGIAQTIGASIVAESVPGHGATFRVRFPTAALAAAPTSETGPQRSGT